MIKPDNMEEREEAARLYMESMAAGDAVDDAPDTTPDAEYEALAAKANAAAAAYGEHPLELWETDDRVVSKNLHRRHLSESQRSMVGDRVATLKQGGTGANQYRADASIEASAGKASAASQTQAAKQLSVSRSSIQKARIVHDKGIPELQKAVEAGEVSVSAASEWPRCPRRDRRR